MPYTRQAGSHVKGDGPCPANCLLPKVASARILVAFGGRYCTTLHATTAKIALLCRMHVAAAAHRQSSLLLHKSNVIRPICSQDINTLRPEALSTGAARNWPYHRPTLSANACGCGWIFRPVALRCPTTQATRIRETPPCRFRCQHTPTAAWPRPETTRSLVDAARSTTATTSVKAAASEKAPPLATKTARINRPPLPLVVARRSSVALRAKSGSVQNDTRKGTGKRTETTPKAPIRSNLPQRPNEARGE